MKAQSSCHLAIQNCLDSRSFAIAHLYKEERTMEMHIHNCYEIYYSISGARQFIIDNCAYPICPGDIFFINQYESHKLAQLEETVHERIVISLYPEYVHNLSTDKTNLDACFSSRPAGFSHRLSLDKEQQKRFLYYINKLTNVSGYGQDVIETSIMMELLVFLNSTCLSHHVEADNEDAVSFDSQKTMDILSYINANISNPISIQQLASHFYLSPSYLSRIFRASTGTTITKYITARRITIAKVLLSEGASVMSAFEGSGFTDYSNFYKSFTKAVGISPKKFAQLSLQ